MSGYDEVLRASVEASKKRSEEGEVRTFIFSIDLGYESHLWDSFLYAAADADFAGPAVTLRCPDIL